MKNRYLFLCWLLLLSSFGSSQAWAQATRRVSGTVRASDSGEGLPGVTVLVKGTNSGASTNTDGGYELNVPATGGVTLSFSFVGYSNKEVAVGDQSQINVTLAVDTKQLDDVVVIGYQAVQRRDVTGSVSSVSAQQIKDVPVNSAAEALSGRLAGVQVTSSEGTPGNQNVSIRVRGGGSVTQDNSPLYVVDGVQVENALNVISPQDIQSVDVLKDAAATAIYGARGANGVVIITTKGGKEGKLVVSYNGFAGVRQLSRKLDVMQPADFVNYQYERAVGIDRVAGNGTSVGGLNTFKAFFKSRNYNSDTLNLSRNSPFLDWQDQVFGRDAFQQTHNISLSGGSATSTYALSVTRNNEDGIQLGSGFTRNLVNFRFDNKATDKFRFGVNVRYNDQQVDGLGTSSQLSTTTTRLRNSVEYLPLAVNLPGAFDTNAFDESFYTNSSLVNPILAIQSDIRHDKQRTLNLAGNASFNFTKDLAFRSTVGFDIGSSTLESFSGRNSPAIRQPGGGFNLQPSVAIALGSALSINQSNVLTYAHQIGKHSFDALIGQEIYQQASRLVTVQTNFLPLDITAEQAIANINQGVLPSSSFAQPTPTSDLPTLPHLLSGFGRLNYSYDDKYLATVTFRADGSSKFAPGRRVGYFPAVSLAWRISHEDFMKSLANTVSDLKLRLSYGQAGNNRINDFGYSQYFRTGAGQYSLNHSVTQGTVTTGLPNPFLNWETTTARNAGVDLSLFNNRVQFSADAYYNTTHNLLVNVPITPTSGYQTQFQNVGSTTNRGLEFQLSGAIIKTPDFTWSASGNASMNRGRIEELGPISSIPGVYSGWASTTIASDFLARVGDPVGIFYGYQTDGFYTADDFTGYNATTRTWTLKPGVVNDVAVQGQPLAPGIIKLKNVVDTPGAATNIVDANDRVAIGNANPKVTGGINQQFTYKGFDASVFFNFVYGNQVYNANKIEFTTAVNPFSNLLTLMNDRYRTVDNNGVAITDLEVSRNLNQNATIWQPTRTLFVHSWAIEDGSFLRLNNVTLGYSLPKALIAKAKLTQLRFYVTGNNLYTWTKYSGFDPEANTRRASPLTPGVDYAGYPRSRVLLFGVNLSL
ncbi:SusC/RagA family TonB-linked outer membrane protein [Hymenobacter terricola]|uniref:SusC/RagA family TonB-linked outer membrane protein n=1 Tax=Hymenobacter terricola TaxID=2819236 RepID=UPI001B30D40F|nr:TonB-dependent receptor [Hymenobacter terricola]